MADSTGGIKVVRGAVKQPQSPGAGVPTLLAMQKVCHNYITLHVLDWSKILHRHADSAMYGI